MSSEALVSLDILPKVIGVGYKKKRLNFFVKKRNVGKAICSSPPRALQTKPLHNKT